MMNAGRELDALIALQVFRYTLDYEFADTLGAPCVRELRNQYEEWGILPHYSTELGDAWLVAAHIHDSIANQSGDGKRDDLNFLELAVVSRYGASAASFDVLLSGDWVEHTDELPFAARGDMPAHAICLAALRVCRVPL